MSYAMFQVDPVAMDEYKRPPKASKYGFATFGVGSAIVVPKSEAIQARSAAHNYGFKNGKKMRARKNEDGSVTIWREA